MRVQLSDAEGITHDAAGVTFPVDPKVTGTGRREVVRLEGSDDYRLALAAHLVASVNGGRA
jgi:hypothetical protein